MRRVLVVGVTALIGVFFAASASAAGNQNGEGKRSPAQVVADAKRALRQASSFTISGSYPDKGKTLRVNLVATNGQGGGGSVAENGTFDLVVAQPDLFVRGDASFWVHYAGADQTGAGQIAGQWLRAKTTNTHMAQLVQFANVNYWSNKLYMGGGKLTKGSQRTFRGAPVVAVHDASGADPGTLLVAATGTPYPIALIPDHAAANEALVLGNFNTATPPAAPTGAIDLPNS